MPAIEVAPGKFLMLYEDPPNSGMYFIPVLKIGEEFKIMIQPTSGGEKKYERDPTIQPGPNEWIMPMIEHSDGNGHIPIRKQ